MGAPVAADSHLLDLLRRLLWATTGEGVGHGAVVSVAHGALSLCAQLPVEPEDIEEAWRSGASNWTTSRRQSFANDLTHPQLIAVTENVNQVKGDQETSIWQPPLSSYLCT
ncbi:hypothetical protein [Micromonospora aurantiaca (nom. illeg.)]|uniref:hypothetical protein n=1 Tax=Micromonospora aurantiaca (nom. illeg.) TaxID=47850 RepID=UPI0033DC3C9C